MQPAYSIKLDESFSTHFKGYKELIRLHLVEKIKGYQSHNFGYFMDQLDKDLTYNEISGDFRGWLSETANWYFIPHQHIKVHIPQEMSVKEHKAQCAARHLLFDAIIGIDFVQHYTNLIPLMFAHWKNEIIEAMESQEAKTAMRNAHQLSTLSEELQILALAELNILANRVHGELKSVWSIQIIEKFEQWKTLQNADVTMNSIATLLPAEYTRFRDTFFKRSDISQCIEPIFAKVLGHDRFFPVFLCPRPPVAPIKTAQEPPQDLLLGNSIPQYVIAPCDIRCQYHALGHLYTGDMLSYQSADHLDAMRIAHGLGNLPDQLMSFDEIADIVH